MPRASASPLHAPSHAPSHESASLHNAHTHNFPIESSTKDMELLKNLKPPIFKGEDKERNKDNVDTFLSKWAEIHDMRGTHDHLKPRHTCLALEGKA